MIIITLKLYLNTFASTWIFSHACQLLDYNNKHTPLKWESCSTEPGNVWRRKMREREKFNGVGKCGGEGLSI
jgi:hypothetical protein